MECSGGSSVKDCNFNLCCVVSKIAVVSQIAYEIIATFLWQNPPHHFESKNLNSHIFINIWFAKTIPTTILCTS